MRFAAISAVATILVLAIGCEKHAPEAQAPPTPNVVVAQPRVETIQGYDQFIGRAAAMESVELRSRIAGYLIDIGFTDGQEVTKGTLLFQIDPAPYQVDLKRGEMQLVAAQGLFEVNGQEVDRIAALVKENAASPVELDRAIAKREEARATMATAQSTIDTAKLNLGYAAMRAPIDGRLSAPNLTVGNLVNSDALLTTLVRTHPIYIYFDVDERSLQYYRKQLQAAGLTLEQAFKSDVQILLARGSDEGFPLKARLDFIDNQLDEQTNTARTRAVFENVPSQLAPGEFVTVRVPRGRPAESLMVPERAIGRDQDRNYVFIVGADNKVEYRPVTLGQLRGADRQILEGLKQGEWVIIEGVQRAKPGKEVVAQKQAPATAPSQMPATQPANAPATQPVASVR